MKPLNTVKLPHVNQPIGVFDSGLGGLSIYKCLASMLPNEQLFYVADNAYAPYGCKSEEEINQRVAQVCRWLINQNVKAIVVACNTATASAIDHLREQYAIPIIGVEPAIKPAVATSKTQKIGILVTRATAYNERFRQLVARYKADSDVIIQPCPGLVDLIESGQHQSNECKQLLNNYVTPLVQSGVDTIVLGCTHYPFLANIIQEIVGEKVQLIETAKPVTEQLIRQLTNRHLLNRTDKITENQYFASSPNANLAMLASQLINQKIAQIQPFVPTKSVASDNSQSHLDV